MQLINKKSLNIVFFSLIATSLVLLMSGVIFGETPSESQQPDRKPTIVGTIISTSNPGLIKRQLKANGVAIERSHALSTGKTLIAVEKDYKPNVAQVLGLKKRGENASYEVYPNYQYQAQFTPNDPKFAEDQWNLTKISAPKAWDISKGSSDTTIAVIDTGVLFEQSWGWDSNDEDSDPDTFTQPDFPTTKRWENSGEIGMTELGEDCFNVLPEDKTSNGCDDDGNGWVDDWQGWDFMGGWRGTGGENAESCPNNVEKPSDIEHPDFPEYVTEDNDPQPYSCDDPDDHDKLNKNDSGANFIGHGTLVGSVASAATDNDTLMAGIDHNAKIMNLRALDGYGIGFSDEITAAIDYAVANGADVINLSLAVTGCGDDSINDAMEDSLAAAANNDIIVAAASGNDGIDSVCYPASSPHTLAVGATNDNNERALFSNYGDKLDLLAPGQDVPAATAPSSSNEGAEYVYASGTSLSTPHIAGAAGLLKHQVPDVTFNEAKNALHQGVDKIAEMDGQNRTNEHGYGRLNLHKLLKFGIAPHPDGMLVQKQGRPHVFLIKDGKRQYIPSPAVFASHNLKWGEIKPATLQDMRLAKISPLDFREGTLLKAKDGNKIYIVDRTSDEKVRKRHIGSPGVFTKLGFKMSEVKEINKNKLPSQNGPAVTSTSTHPDGVLVSGENSTKIYLIEDGNKRHIASLAVFASQGFEWGKIKEATSGDLELPTASRLTFMEGTLVKDKNDHPIYVVNYQDGAVEKRHVKTLFIYKLLDLGSSKLYKVNEILLPNQTGDPIR